MRQLQPHGNDDSGPVGILAGRGAVVTDLAQAIVTSGRQVHIAAISGFASENITQFPHTWVGLGQLAHMLRTLRNAGCRDLVIIGGLERPDLSRLRFDFGAIWHARDIYALTHGGDDGMLRVVVRFFENQGFAVRGVGDVAPGLIATQGHLAGPPPSTAHVSAIERGQRALAALATFDIGQAVVASAEGVVAIEAAEGTQRMLTRLARELSADRHAASGTLVLIKLPKRGQEMRIDLPTIGAETIEQAQAAAVQGIVVGAGATILAECERLLAAAQRTGIFVEGIAWESATATTSRPASVKGADDQVLAARVCSVALAHVPLSTTAIAAIVRRGHVLALAVDALVPGRLTDRVGGVPRGWGRLLSRSRDGVLYIHLLAEGEAGGIDTAVLARNLKRARLAQVTVCFDGSARRLHDAAQARSGVVQPPAVVAVLAEAARQAGIPFTCENKWQGGADGSSGA